MRGASRSLREHLVSKGLTTTAAGADRIVEELFDSFTWVSAPEEPPMEFMTLDSIRRRGRSLKPGNIILNAKALFAKVIEGTLVLRGAVLPKIDSLSLILAFLIILASIFELASLEIGELEAAVLWTMWLKRDDRNCVRSASLRAQVNSQLSKFGKSPISQTELMSVRAKLQQMGCIKYLKVTDEWRCVERVTNSYY